MEDNNNSNINEQNEKAVEAGETKDYIDLLNENAELIKEAQETLKDANLALNFLKEIGGNV